MEENQEMSITVKFLILYLIPVLTFVGSFGVYFHAYGKSPENTFINFGFFIVVCAFFASSTLALSLVHHFLLKQNSYVGVVFSLIPWFAAIIVIILYLVVFYGFFNP